MALASRNSAAALLARYREDQRSDDLTAALKHFEGAALMTGVRAPGFRLREAGAALSLSSNEPQVVRGLDLLYFAASLEPDPDRRAATVAELGSACAAAEARIKSQPVLALALDMARLVRGQGAASISRLGRHAGRLASLLETVEAAVALTDRASGGLPKRGVGLEPDKRNLAPDLLGYAVVAAGGVPSQIIWVLLRMLDGDRASAALDALNQFAAELLRTYEERPHSDLLDHAVEALGAVLPRAPAGSASRRMAVLNLKTALLERHQRSGRLDDLDLASGIVEDALAHEPDNIDYLAALGDVLAARHRVTGSVEDLDRALELNERVFSHVPSASTERAVRLGTIATLLIDRWNVSDDPCDLDRSLALVDGGLATDLPAARSHFLLVSRLIALGARYGARGDRRDLDDALGLSSRLLADLPADSRERPRLLQQRGSCLRAAYALDPDPALLADAIASYKKAIAALPRDAGGLGTYFSDLSTALSDRFEATGDLQDLDDAVAANEAALAAAEGTAVDRPLILDHLASHLLRRYRIRGSASDLDASAKHARTSVAAAPPTDAKRVYYLTTLGNALFERYRAGSLAGHESAEDLRAAAAAYEEALQGASAESPVMPSALGNRGMALFALAVAGEVPDTDLLKDAASHLERAVAHPAASPADLPRYWVNLGYAQKALGDAGLDRAVAAFRQAGALAARVAPGEALGIYRPWGDWSLSRGAWAEAAEAYAGASGATQALFRAQLSRSNKEA